MRIAIFSCWLLCAASAGHAAACSLLNPCKPVHNVHRIHKTNKTKPAAPNYEKRLGDHERRLAMHDAQFKAAMVAIAALQRQVTELKAGR